MSNYFLDSFAIKVKPAMLPGFLVNRCLGVIVAAVMAVFFGISSATALEPDLATAASTSVSSTDEAEAVGSVSLVLGVAYVEDDKGQRQRLRVGVPVNVSDRIITEANGHVHINFIDKGLVSVRPSSRLEIVSYDYNAKRPELSTVKFNLEEGVTRSISGDAASSAKDRFRLNTPIAAIGVRGTDFVVSANQQSVRAQVNEGVIVMAPYSDECSVEAIGPCGANAVELAGTSFQMIEMEGGTPLPRLLPAPDERDNDSMRQEVQLAIADAEDTADEKSTRNDVFLEGVTSPRVTAEAAQVADELAVPPQPAVDFTPELALSSSVLNERQLIWGRWADEQSNAEKITVAMAAAQEGRSVAVGNYDYRLYRTIEDSTRVERGLGLVRFDLNSAQAFYSSDTGVVAMQVRGGSLDIDFDSSEFSTELNLEHALTGAIDIIGAGEISDAGHFNSRTDEQRISGSVSIDGSEAGYFFERQLEEGGIDGLTIWDRQ